MSDKIEDLAAAVLLEHFRELVLDHRPRWQSLLGGFFEEFFEGVSSDYRVELQGGPFLWIEHYPDGVEEYRPQRGEPDLRDLYEERFELLNFEDGIAWANGRRLVAKPFPGDPNLDTMGARLGTGGPDRRLSPKAQVIDLTGDNSL